ncbi:MAG: hypothetical protein ACOC2L_04910, partial [Candidatus Sumerlaeota bacterium]
KAAQDKSLKNLALTKVAHSMAMIGMIDLAEETLEDATLLMDNEKHADEAKGLVYTIAHMLEEDEQYQRALKLYKEIFRVDAGFRDVVEKMEKLNV